MHWKLSLAVGLVPQFRPPPLHNRRTPNNCREHCRYRRRQQAILAEVMNDKGLQVQQPQSHEKHDGGKAGQERPGGSITESRQDRQTENRKVGKRAQGRQRHGTDMRVRTAEDF